MNLGGEKKKILTKKNKRVNLKKEEKSQHQHQPQEKRGKGWFFNIFEKKPKSSILEHQEGPKRREIEMMTKIKRKGSTFDGRHNRINQAFVSDPVSNHEKFSDADNYSLSSMSYSGSSIFSQYSEEETKGSPSFQNIEKNRLNHYHLEMQPSLDDIEICSPIVNNHDHNSQLKLPGMELSTQNAFSYLHQNHESEITYSQNDNSNKSMTRSPLTTSKNSPILQGCENESIWTSIQNQIDQARSSFFERIVYTFQYPNQGYQEKGDGTSDEEDDNENENDLDNESDTEGEDEEAMSGEDEIRMTKEDTITL